MELFDRLIGRDKKREREFKKTVRAMDSGSASAKRLLRDQAQQGSRAFVPRIANARVDMYSQAACEGDRQARYLVGMSLAQLGEKEVSLEWLTGLAQKGDVRAMKAIAEGYAPGGPFGDHPQERNHWNRKAAEAGDAQAQARLGMQYAGKDEKKARYWLVRSAKQGCSEGLLGLGKSSFQQALSCFGDAQKERRRKLFLQAETCFLKAADAAENKKAFAAACHELGRLYGLEASEQKEPEKAAYFYYQAGANGDYPEDTREFGRLRDEYHMVVDLSDIGHWEELVFGKEG